MDAANRFDTRGTNLLIRLEYLVALLVCVGLLVLHLPDVRWLPALLLFVHIDVVGYLPGLVAFHRSPNKRIARFYYVLYNTMHSFVTQAAVVGVWVLVAGWEWALLAIPIHLCGDRALFGNFLKPFAVRFEPEPHPAYLELRGRIESPADAAAAPRRRATEAVTT